MEGGSGPLRLGIKVCNKCLIFISIIIIYYYNIMIISESRKSIRPMFSPLCSAIPSQPYAPSRFSKFTTATRPPSTPPENPNEQTSPHRTNNCLHLRNTYRLTHSQWTIPPHPKPSLKSSANSPLRSSVNLRVCSESTGSLPRSCSSNGNRTVSRWDRMIRS